jgi:hypothetical protein
MNIKEEDLMQIAMFATNRLIEGLDINDFHIEHHGECSIDIRFLDNIYEVINIDEQLNVLVYNDLIDPKIERRVQNQILIVEFLKLKKYAM